MREEKTLQMQQERVPKILLIGNGINRAYDFPSWGELIRKIQTKKLSTEEIERMEAVPYPFQPVILTEDNVGTKMKEISSELAYLRPTTEEESVLREFADLPVDAILTTNYTYELEKALISKFECISGRRCKYRKKAVETEGKFITDQLCTYFFGAGTQLPIWHIHGEAAKADTMILGHYYYGKLLSKMQLYISNLLKRYKVNIANGNDLEIRSWIDYFMLGDVYIVGLGMALSEFDLWWLVNCKKRHFPERKIVLYKPDITLEERLLAEAYNVEVIQDGLKEDCYKEYYDWVCRQVKYSIANE